MWDLKNNINKTKQKQAIHTGNTLRVVRWEGLGGLDEEDEGLQNISW